MTECWLHALPGIPPSLDVCAVGGKFYHVTRRLSGCASAAWFSGRLGRCSKMAGHGAVVRSTSHTLRWTAHRTSSAPAAMPARPRRPSASASVAAAGHPLEHPGMGALRLPRGMASTGTARSRACSDPCPLPSPATWRPVIMPSRPLWRRQRWVVRSLLPTGQLRRQTKTSNGTRRGGETKCATLSSQKLPASWAPAQGWP